MSTIPFINIFLNSHFIEEMIGGDEGKFGHYIAIIIYINL